MLLDKIKKDIDEIKTASNRILIIVLVVGITVLSSVYFKMITDRLKVMQGRIVKCEELSDRLYNKIDSLRSVVIMKTEIDNDRLRARIQWQDSVKEVLQTIIRRK